MATEVQPLRLAIIGAGVSGLATAFYLQQQQQPGQRPLHIDIYERKSAVGGNADTVVVDLGDYIDAQGARSAYLRWADLGVNDVNLATYVELKKVLETIGYLDKLMPLQDTACYFSHDGSLAITDDAALRNGVTDPAFSLDKADGGKLARLLSAVHRSAFGLLDGAIAPEYTVGNFFDDCLSNPEKMLTKAAGELDIAIDWTDPGLPARLRQVRDAIYYPRISAMYFTDDRGPATLPLQSPFGYYALQEGKNQAADRRYFQDGAQKWLMALAAYVVARSNAQVSVSIHTGSAAEVEVWPGHVTVASERRGEHQYALCVLTTHADDTLALLEFKDMRRDDGRRIGSILSSVNYTTGYAVCHNFDGVMPRNRKIWRTYNVLQRDSGDTSFPYRMSYVGNLHQNDPANPDYARAGLPLFLISMVSSLNEIPYHAMLDRVRDTRRTNPHRPVAMPNLMEREPREASPASHPNLAGKAWTTFKHNVLDLACIRAQADIARHNQAVATAIAGGELPGCGLLFGGGWTIGAGLHEQCLRQSGALAQALLPALRQDFSFPEGYAPAFGAKAA